MPMRPLLALATLACACGFVPLPRDRWGSARLSKVIDVEPIEPEDSDLDAALGADDAAGAARAASSLSMGEALTTEGRRLDDLVQSASGGLSEDELRAAWTAELQASLNNHGAELCAGAYEGHMRHGRGALMLNFEVDGESAHPAATDALAELVRGRTTELDAGRGRALLTADPMGPPPYLRTRILTPLVCSFVAAGTVARVRVSARLCTRLKTVVSTHTRTQTRF